MRSIRGVCCFSSLYTTQFRVHATYDVAPLSHKELFSIYQNWDKTRDELDLLEEVEERISKWKLNKWEMRIPPLLTAREKELMRQQQELLKSIFFDWGKCRDALNKDLELISSITGLPKGTVREKNRAWLQEEAAKLRWVGEVSKATRLRDAFLRLEVYGSRDHRLLERLCCIYGLGLQGSFESAFSNYIVEDPITKKIYVDEKNSFRDLLAYIIHTYPQIDIIYDFLGFNFIGGYRSSLRRYLECMVSRSTEGEKIPGRLVFGRGKPAEILFDFGNSNESLVSGECTQGFPDFVFVKGSDMTLIIIASENSWLRNRQLPHRKQMEGIARRASFVLGIPFSEVRVRNLLLPPTYLDKDSIVRINEAVLGLSKEEQRNLAPWLEMYQKELDSKDVDFCSLMKSTNEEEWLTL
ncbi:hypothetical protein, conserved [Trypanosoma cruzi]|uniref:Uncharacterized protein n=1 Tax=Trypanosoma cruzi (strain CL Brener) TaxID=353153 RepID=Q4D4C7_TRYCC|nr:hypothetical protein, conserved [Trypanosoma cruzi]EAN87380.1 hypothetical protein, conserved [Trypanosoma cruzi]7AOR_ai Chain ai, mS56 [Trypanosoma cruzi strain CL Brener]|eukprot:XP_809231.1 hypothetical protein [Trypanosoma cruzi strain CL Brener]